MDAKKDIEEIKKEWFNQVEEDSKNLFKIAEEAIKKKPSLNVIIVKRLPRYDRSSQDIIGIKSKLSTFANSVYDQLWIKHGCPSNIKIVELKLNSDCSINLRNIIYGNIKHENVDGIHLRGPAASRHFTYRAVQALKPVLCTTGPTSHHRRQRNSNLDRKPQNKIGAKKKKNHMDCPQAIYQRNSGKPSDRTSYAQTVKGNYGYAYSVPTSNLYDHLN